MFYTRTPPSLPPRVLSGQATHHRSERCSFDFFSAEWACDGWSGLLCKNPFELVKKKKEKKWSEDRVKTLDIRAGEVLRRMSLRNTLRGDGSARKKKCGASEKAGIGHQPSDWPERGFPGEIIGYDSADRVE